jgi:hypothetical protein
LYNTLGAWLPSRPLVRVPVDAADASTSGRNNDDGRVRLKRHSVVAVESTASPD